MTTSDVARKHDHRVRRVASALAERSADGTRAHVAKGGVHHVVPLPGDRRFASRPIDTSDFLDVLDIDVDARTVTAECSVTFEQLVRATLPHGLAPKVVPELRGITVGGAVSGCSVESMSYRYGGFHDSCIEYEVVTGDGQVLTLDRESSPDLFESIHGGYGTLGVLTKVTAQLVPASPYVEMEYRRFGDYPSYRDAMLDACRLDIDQSHDFVDGIAFAPDSLILCLGTFVEHPKGVPSVYSGEEIYYLSARDRHSDVLSAEEYFFRYDGECHWLTATVPPLQWRWLRRLAGKHLLGSTNLIGWANRVAPLSRRIMRRPDVVCDVFIAEDRLDEFWRWYERDFDFWPLWLVPYRAPLRYPWIGDEHAELMQPGELIVDLAIYGKRNLKRAVDHSAQLEQKVYELGGLKTLIGRNHHTREQFWTVYNQPNYQEAKEQLDPTGAFPDLYDKLGRVE